jgi:hypothetical protein
MRSMPEWKSKNSPRVSDVEMIGKKIVDFNSLLCTALKINPGWVKFFT